MNIINVGAKQLCNLRKNGSISSSELGVIECSNLWFSGLELGFETLNLDLFVEPFSEEWITMVFKFVKNKD